eukprot:12147423-Prorocentrum_lima.AAC.1
MEFPPSIKDLATNPSDAKSQMNHARTASLAARTTIGWDRTRVFARNAAATAPEAASTNRKQQPIR